MKETWWDTWRAGQTKTDCTHGRAHGQPVQIRLLPMRLLQDKRCKLNRAIRLRFADEDDGGSFACPYCASFGVNLADSIFNLSEAENALCTIWNTLPRRQYVHDPGEPT
jgi:hypothetical protein